MTRLYHQFLQFLEEKREEQGGEQNKEVCIRIYYLFIYFIVPYICVHTYM